MSDNIKVVGRRNWVAKSAIMRKGGVHDKCNKAKRQKDKQAFKRKLRAEQFGSFYLKNLINSINTELI